MTLSRQNVTVAAQIMLPTYPILAVLIGLNYILVADSLPDAAAIFRLADSIVPLEVWGCGFILVGVAQVVALVAGSRRGYQSSLAVMAGAMFVWAVVALAAAFFDTGSYSAALWPTFVAVACYASFRSIDQGEA